MGTCASQQETEQNTSAVRGRLQVDTLQAQKVAANGSSFLQVEHRFQNDGSAAIGMPCARGGRYFRFLALRTRLRPDFRSCLFRTLRLSEARKRAVVFFFRAM